jgi:alcohol dehydrogenase
VDTKERDAAEALRELGFAKVVLTTSPDGGEMKGLLGGLGPEGRLVVLSVPRGGKVDVDVGVLVSFPGTEGKEANGGKEEC